MKVDMKNCKWVPLTDLLLCIVDNRGKTCPTAEKGFPLIATNCIKNSSIYPTFENIRYVTDETLHTWFRAELKPNDILFVNKGTPGRVCLVPDPVTFCAAQDMVGLRCDPDKIYYRFLFAVLRSDFIQEKIRNYHVGIAIPHFKKSDMDELLIPVPSMEIQHKIGDLYFILSDKIEKNNDIATQLESLARDIYDYWFIQFDFPDENGRSYRSSGGKMVWNSEIKREIPEGWEVKKLGDTFTTERGISYNTSNIKAGKGVPMLNLATFMPGSGTYKEDGIKYFLGDYPANKILKPYDLIMCNTQQTAVNFDTDIIGRAMLVPDIFDGDILSSHHVNVIRTKDENLKYYLLYLFNSDFFHKYISGFTNGTNILGLFFNGVEDYITEIPPTSILNGFAHIVMPVATEISRIIKENRQLSSLRDFLLPLLMNGQVTFKEAEKMVEKT